MFFKNLKVYPFTVLGFTAEHLAEKLPENAFTECAKREPSSFGFVSPCPGSDALSHLTMNKAMICAQREERILPPVVIKKALAEKVAELEKSTGEKIYRKQQEGIKEELVHDMLPQAFTKLSKTYAYIDWDNQWLVIDTSSNATADALVSLLRNAVGSLPLALPQVIDAPFVVMSKWLRSGELPENLSPRDECELREAGESGGIIKCKNQDLFCEEVTAHLNTGKAVIKLGMEWKDSATFVLDESLSIKRFKLSDALLAQADSDAMDDSQAVKFDADFILMAATITDLFTDVTSAFGGLKNTGGF